VLLFLAALLVLAVAAHYLVVTRHRGLATIDGIFPIAQLVMGLGTLALVDIFYPPDVEYAYVISGPTIIYCVTSCALYLGRPSPERDHPNPIVVDAPISPVVWALLILSVLVTIVYYVAVGYNVFVLGLQGLAGKGAGQDLTQLRIDSYSADRYLYPGYVNQFKNILLPALSIVVVWRSYSNRWTLRHGLAASLFAITAISVLGTGQRGGFVIVTLFVGAVFFWADRRRFAHRASLLMLGVLPLLTLATLFLGRSLTSVSRASSELDKLGVILQELGRRITYDNQAAGQQAFRYTYRLETENGGEWLTGVMGLLPGHSGSSLPQDVFFAIYGTDRGSAPPSLWGSIAHNFGWIGLLIMPVILAIVFHWITGRLLAKSQRTPLEIVATAGFCVVVGLWVIGGPEYLLNAGAVTFAGLMWIGSRVARSYREVPSSASSTSPVHSDTARTAASPSPNI